jgi:hypothetical protein
MNPPLLLLILGVAIGFLGLLAQWLKAEKTSYVILRIAQIPIYLWIAWWVLAYLYGQLFERNSP